MQTVIEMPTIQITPKQNALLQLANVYLDKILGACYRVTEGRCVAKDEWQFLVVYHSPVLKRPCTTGKLSVDSQHSMVRPLTNSQIQEIQERALIAVAEERQELPWLNGSIPKVFARRKANYYLSNRIGFFFTAIDGEFVPLQPSIWRFPIHLRLPRTGDLGLLAMIDVNAQTGEVTPFTTEQTKQIQDQANALIRNQTQSPTT